MTTVLRFPQSRLLVGVAQGEITPPVGIYHRMWGAATHDQSTGIHRPLTATALYLAPQDSTTHQAAKLLVGVDHCLLWPAEMQRLLGALVTATGLQAEQIRVCFSHTHAAGLMDSDRRELPGGELIVPYLQQLAAILGQLALAARKHAAEAVISYNTGRCDLAANRDYFDAERQHYVCGFNPDGTADDTLLVARIQSADGPLLGTIVNYACHPTTLAWENRLISPDYVGAMRDVVEQATGVPCLFLQGASGDLGPREGYVGDTEVADRNGRQLGYAALAALENLPPPGQRFVYAGPVVSGATLGTWKYIAESADELASQTVWQSQPVALSLAYRSDLPTRDQLQKDQRDWQAKEQSARDSSDDAAAQHARAMAERAARRLTRSGTLPEGRNYPFTADVWRMGDAVWVALEGEHYNVLQRRLRASCAHHPLVVTTLANGSRAWYLPDAESYGKGLYQEEASVLARGSLEQLIEAIAESIQKLVGTS